MLSSSLRHTGSGASFVLKRYAASSALAGLTANGGDVNRIKGTAKRLIKGAKESQNPAWRHTTGKKGEKKRLEQDVLASSGQRDAHKEPNTFANRPMETWSVEELLQSGSTALQPGTYLEVRRSTETLDGVVLASGVNNIGRNEDVISISTRGEVFVNRSSDVMFAVPNFVDNFLVERCGTSETHEDDHQLAARLRVLRAAREFDRAVEKEMHRLGRAMRDIYPQVRARHPNEWEHVTTMQVARMLNATPNVSVITLFAVHRQLMDRADEFVCHPTRHRFAHSFDVRPLSHLKNIEAVKQMVRENNPVIHYFHEKAKFLIDRSRELAASSVGEPPSRADISDMKFTPKEQEIITFLRHSISHERRIQQDPYEGMLPALIKDTNRYDEIITVHVALRFLREIGVFTPWEDTASKDKDLYLPSTTGDSIILPIAEATPSSTARKEPTKTSGLLTIDEHASVRHDFGDLPVYVIDDATAEELDDGVSIESVPGEPDSAWIHVHVADPTAIIPIIHPLAQEMQKRTETIYFAHQTYPMLPDDVAKLCDMGRADASSSGQNVLTFSAKIGSDGQILDYKVRVGRVRNVHKIKYDDVSAILLDRTDPIRFTPFEPELTGLDVVDSSYVLPHAGDLRRLFEVTRRLMEDRFKKGIFAFSFNYPEVEFLDKPVLRNPSHVVHPILYRGYPRLRYYTAIGQACELGSRSLVAECMKVASRVASRFCLDHNIAAIRRGMTNVLIDEDKLSRIRAARDDNGFVDVDFLAQIGTTLPLGESSVKPIGHWLLGIPEGEGYVRVTSPLRRAEDMLAHWQIKSALLPGGGAPPPLDEDEMKRVLEDMSGPKQTLKKAYRAHERQWSHTYIERFMAEQRKADTWYSESNPLLRMEGYVLGLPIHNYVRWSQYQDVYLPKLGISAVLPVKYGDAIPIGSRIKVNAKNLFQYDLNQVLELELA
ncbi:MSU1 [Sanghuangporus weigelae]